MFACNTNDGVRVRERQCDNPIPTFGRCPGQHLDYINGVVLNDYIHKALRKITVNINLKIARSWMLGPLDFMVNIWVHNWELWTRKQDTDPSLLIRTRI